MLTTCPLRMCFLGGFTIDPAVPCGKNRMAAAWLDLSQVASMHNRHLFGKSYIASIMGGSGGWGGAGRVCVSLAEEKAARCDVVGSN